MERLPATASHTPAWATESHQGRPPEAGSQRKATARCPSAGSTGAFLALPGGFAGVRPPCFCTVEAGMAHEMALDPANLVLLRPIGGRRGLG